MATDIKAAVFARAMCYKVNSILKVVFKIMKVEENE